MSINLLSTTMCETLPGRFGMVTSASMGDCSTDWKEATEAWRGLTFHKTNRQKNAMSKDTKDVSRNGVGFLASLVQGMWSRNV